MPKTRTPQKRAYKKRNAMPKFVISTNDTVIIKDELDLLRDMLASFESMNDEGRARAYAFFTNKYSRYGIANF